MMEKEDQKCLLVTGGIEVFLPHRSTEVRYCMDDTTTTEGKLAMTVKEEGEMGQTLEPNPTEEEEHSI
jgi:hypothetical protein